MKVTTLDLGRALREVTLCTLVEIYVDAPVHSGRLKMMFDLDGLLTEEQWATLETWIAERFDAEYDYAQAIDALEDERETGERRAKRHARLRTIASPAAPACVVCGLDDLDALEVDHVVPRSRGGSNALHNLQLLCGPCNQAKGARTMEEWRGARP